MSFAVFYILTGNEYITEARVSANSVHRHMPFVSRYLFTPDEKVVPGVAFDSVIRLPPRVHEYWYLDGIRYLEMALNDLPEYLLWLDSDVYAIAPFGELFDMLDRFDITGVASPARHTTRTVHPIPDCFPELVAGSNGMRNGAMLQDFAHRWYRQFCEHLEVYGNNDQGPLRECLWEQAETNTVMDCFNFWCYPPEYHLRLVSKDGYYVSGKVRCFHGRPNGQKLQDSWLTLDRWAAQVNSREDLRIWKPS